MIKENYRFRWAVCLLLCFAVLAVRGVCLLPPALRVSAQETENGAPKAEENLPFPDSDEQVAETLEARLLRGLTAEENTIDLSQYGINEEELRAAFSSLYASVPELYFVASSYSLRTAGERVLYMRPQYRFTGQARRRADMDFAARIADITAPVTETWSALEKVTYLHDYMVTHFAYDYAYEVYDPYTLLTEGRGVCQAYTLLFCALCRAVGVDCEAVLCFEMEHEWNQVRIGDNWYHVDLTWDETELPYLNRVPHTYFLLDDDTLRARRAEAREDWQNAAPWTSPHACGDPHFARTPLSDTCGCMAVNGEGLIYYATRLELRCIRAVDGQDTSVFSFPSEAAGDPFVTAVFLDGAVYFNLPDRIWRVSAPGAVAAPLGAPLDSSDGSRYFGLAAASGVLAAQTALP